LSVFIDVACIFDAKQLKLCRDHKGLLMNNIPRFSGRTRLPFDSVQKAADDKASDPNFEFPESGATLKGRHAVMHWKQRVVGNNHIDADGSRKNPVLLDNEGGVRHLDAYFSLSQILGFIATMTGLKPDDRYGFEPENKDKRTLADKIFTFSGFYELENDFNNPDKLNTQEDIDAYAAKFKEDIREETEKAGIQLPPRLLA
jgi:hypothetical protein